MKMLKVFIFSLIFSLSAPLTSQAEQFTVGETSIEVPPPRGYSNILPHAGEARENFNVYTPKESVLLGFYIPTSTLESYLHGDISLVEAINSKQYYMLELADVESSSISSSEFYVLQNQILEAQKGALAAEMRAALKDDSSALNKLIKKNEKGEVELSFPSIIPLNDLHETENSSQFGYLAQLKVKGLPGEAVDGHSHAATGQTGMVRLKGHLLMFLAYRVFQSENDIHSLRNDARSWIASSLHEEKTE